MSLHSVPSGSGYKYSFVLMKRSSQVLAWVLVFGIVGLLIVPPDYRVITGLPRPFEHLSIFLLTGVAFGVGYPDRYPMQSIALVLFAAAVESDASGGFPGDIARLSDCCERGELAWLVEACVSPTDARAEDQGQLASEALSNRAWHGKLYDHKAASPRACQRLRGRLWHVSATLSASS